MTLAGTVPSIIVVRHAPVDRSYRGICYGRSDIPLGAEGEQLSDAVVEELAVWGHATIVHSGLQRTRFLADRLAARLGTSATACDALQERDFGTWEMQSWSDIYSLSGDDMLRMVFEPATYRPGGGETTFEMRDRVEGWFASLPNHELTIAVTHGGPIAALLGSQRQLPVADWVELIPRCGQIVPIHNQSHEQEGSWFRSH
ncbi:MAG: histidine phosphatase family protein [Planctomycetes bacterium]|nr:histidine phosphatase family protein [Planctomycetota bacterium]